MEVDFNVEEKFIQYSDLVYRVAVSYCKSTSHAEDIVQEVFLRYIKTKKSFENEQHEKAWFIRVTINCSKSFLTSSWMKKILPLEEAENVEFEVKEESELYGIIMMLPTKYRITLYLRYFEEYSVNEIAELLHTTPNNISARLSRARKMLREKINLELEEDAHYGFKDISEYVSTYRNQGRPQEGDA